MKNLKICKASAGSGKTYMLTSEFLKLAFKNDDYFRRVLAVTFTNKAANEMKTRILEEVNIIINTPSKSGHLAVLQKTYPETTETELLTRARLIRDQILHNYTHFAVSTIDSFVQKILRTFTYEIGIQGGYKIELDSNKVLEELSDILYRDIETNLNLQKWLVKFAASRIEDGKNWDFRQEIKDLASEIFKETYQLIGSTNVLPENKLINEYFDNLLKRKADFKSTLKKIASETKSVLNSAGLQGNETAKLKYVIDFLTKNTLEDKLEPNKTTKEIIGDVEKWFAQKTDETTKSAIRQIYPAINQKLIDCLEYIQKNSTNYFTTISILDNFYSFGVFNDILNLLPNYREENNLMLISDSTKLLRGLIANNDTPFIYEKTGNKFKNILIDEFQDTSTFQWDIFKPLIENTISEGNFNLIVGDVKQSIYRWRGGDWKLLLEKVQEDIGSDFIQKENLQTNWRSRKNVVDFNNNLFKFAPSCLQNTFNSAIDEIIDEDAKLELEQEGFAELLTKAYEDSSQFIAKKVINDQNGGKVKISFYPNGNKSERREKILIDLPLKIEELLAIQAYKPSDIAILVRTNNEAKIIFDCLLSHQQKIPGAFRYPIISSDSLYVGKSLAVQLLISAIKYLISIEDEINRAELCYKYNLIHSKVDTSLIHNIFRKAKTNELESNLPLSFTENISEFRKLSLFELVEKLIEVFELETHQASIPFIRTFEDLIINFMSTESSDLTKFFEWYELTGHKKSIPVPEDQDALKIMTVHRSKGLAFKIVFIPFCDWDFEQSGQIMWCSTGNSEFNSLDYVPVSYRTLMADTIFRKRYFKEKAYQYMDTLNTLYVATTRAEDELIIYTHSPKNDKGSIANICDLLFAMSKETSLEISQYFDPTKNELLMDHGFNKIEDIKTEVDSKLYELVTYPLNEWRSKMNIKINSNDYFNLESTKRQDQINHGLLMHEIMSKIETIADIENATKEIYFEGKINRKEMETLNTKIKLACEDEKVKDWFSVNYKVMNEKTITLNSGETRIPDRVLIGKTKAIVIDFKFGQMHKEYKNQVYDYMQLIKEIENLPVEGFLFFPETNKIIQIQDQIKNN